MLAALADPQKALEVGLAAVGTIARECADIPKLLAEDLAQSKCKADLSGSIQVLSFMATAMVKQELGDLISDEMVVEGGAKAAKQAAQEELLANLHASNAALCTQPECSAAAKALSARFAHCYSTAMCEALASQNILPADSCRSASKMLLSTALDRELRTMCYTEMGTSTYCSEVAAEIMVRHTACWGQLFHPAGGCSSECREVWLKAREQYPDCTSTLADELVTSQSGAFRFASMLGKQGSLGSLADLIKGATVRSADEICVDLGDSMSLQV